MRKLFLIFSFFINHLIFSQSVPLTTYKGAIFEDDFKKSILILGEKNENNQIILVRTYNAGTISPERGFYIEKYNNELKLLKELNYKMKRPLSQKNNLILGVFYANKKINIIEIYFDLKQKTYICQANCIDDNFIISSKILFTISKEKMNSLGSFNLQQKFFESSKKNIPDVTLGNFDTSADKNFSVLFFGNSTTPKINNSDISIVVNKDRTAYSIILDYKNNEKEGFLLYLFDWNSELIFQKEELIENKERNYALQNFQVADDGKSVFVLAKNYNDKVKKTKYSFELSQIFETETRTKTLEIENKFIKSLILNFQKDAIYCLGFYSETSYNDNDGVCFFKFNSENLVAEKIKFCPFSNQFIQDKFGKETDKDIKDLKIKTVLFENDAVFLNAEEQFENSNNNTNVNESTITVGGNSSYFFNDIVSVKLSIDGDLIWSRNINKKQSYTYSDDSYVSYFSTIKNGISYFFINASEKIKDLKNERIAFKDVNPNNAYLYLLTIDSEGKFNYQTVLTDDQIGIPFLVSKGIVIENSIYFIGKKGKLKQLLKVTL